MSRGFFNAGDAERGLETSFAQPVKIVDPKVATALFYDLEPRVLDDWFDQFLKIIVIAQQWKATLPLIEWVNNRNPELVGKITSGEILEVIEELNAESFILIKFLAEWTDALAPVAGLSLGWNLDIDYKNSVFPLVDGQGARSDAYVRADEISINLAASSEQLTKDIREIYILMLSALKHAPPFTENLIELAAQKMSDNAWNYPSELYSVYAETQSGSRNKSLKELNGQEKDQKYTHVTKCLKWLRSLYPERKLPSDWRQVKTWILAFRSSDESFSMLQTEWFKIHPETLKLQKPVIVYQSGMNEAEPLKN